VQFFNFKHVHIAKEKKAGTEGDSNAIDGDRNAIDENSNAIDGDNNVIDRNSNTIDGEYAIDCMEVFLYCGAHLEMARL